MKRLAVVLVAAAAVVVAYSCGEAEPPPNRAPRAVGTIPAQELAVADTIQVDLSQYFTDEDGDQLTYGAVSGNLAAIGALVTGANLSIVGYRSGQGAIRVTARDPDGLTATQLADVTVRGTPGFLSVELRYGVEDIGAVVLRLQGPPADSIQAPEGLTIYHATVVGGVRTFVAGTLPAQGTLFRFWTEDASAPGDYRGTLEQAAGTDYRQRSVEEGSVRIVK